ncbi:MAG: hypothetical protein ACRYFX_05780 [Janthinobacterium lividum]
MPKPLSYLLTLLAGVLLCGGLLAAKSPAAAKQYDYVTITQRGEVLKISSTPDHFEEQHVKLDRSQSGYEGNFSFLFAKVNEYEGQGYELVENTGLSLGPSGALVSYVMLRRPKQ